MKLGVMMWGLLLAAGLSGCASGPQRLYSWDQYQAQTYQYLQGVDGDAAGQLDKLEKNEQEAKAKGENLPPGFYAHMGLLYAKLGDGEKAHAAFNTEKQLFPESATYMDFLLSDKKKGAAK